MSAGIVNLGLWGGDGGRPWEVDRQIRTIIVRHGDVVESLIFVCINKDGKKVWSPEFGGNRGSQSQEIDLSDGENLVTIKEKTGEYAEYPDQQLVKSLTFVTNKGSYGPYGDKGEGTGLIYLPLYSGPVAGLFGRCGEYVDAIGVRLTGEVKVGPYVDSRGNTPCSYHGPIDKIAIEYGNVINYIIINDSKKFGGAGGSKGPYLLEIKLEPDEYMVTIRGSLGMIEGYQVTTSLVFVSNKRSYAAFGDAPAKISFNLPVNSGKISGFFGKYGWYLDTIGVFMAPN